MRLYPALMTAVLLAGCVGAVTPGVDGAKRTTGAKSSSSPRSSAPPSTPVSIGTSGLPTTVRLEMPASVIATGGLNVISTGGLNVIATGGLNVIATGGLNYRTQASSLAGLSVFQAAYQYESVTRAIDKLLKELAALTLVPGKALTVKNASGKTLTVKLDDQGDHRVIAVYVGDKATAEAQVLGLSYTSPKKGRAVWREQEAEGKWCFATDFDLEAGTVTADGASDLPLAPGSRTEVLDLGHWEFQRYANPGAGKAFSFKQWVYLDKPGTGNTQMAMANFLADDRAALLSGGREADGDFYYFNDITVAKAGEPHDNYLDKANEATARDAAPAALKAIVPTDAEFEAFAPSNPGTGDPFARAAFSFPL
jgi:hypothetical protein